MPGIQCLEVTEDSIFCTLSQYLRAVDSICLARQWLRLYALPRFPVIKLGARSLELFSVGLVSNGVRRLFILHFVACAAFEQHAISRPVDGKPTPPRAQDEEKSERRARLLGSKSNLQNPIITLADNPLAESQRTDSSGLPRRRYPGQQWSCLETNGAITNRLQMRCNIARRASGEHENQLDLSCS